jgi:hypothetical protein
MPLRSILSVTFAVMVCAVSAKAVESPAAYGTASPGGEARVRSEEIVASVKSQGGEKPYCLTPAFLEATLSHKMPTADGSSAGVCYYVRPALPFKYISPEGHFAVHYATSGIDSVQGSKIDTLNGGDGVPDFVNQVAVIADSIWSIEVGLLGFPAPPSDSNDLLGDGPQYDIYIWNVMEWFSGYATISCELDAQRATSIIGIDSDARTSQQTNVPLDAVRSVLAHEFFHAICFGLDYTESHTWMEMSATWAEEAAYPDVDLYMQPLYYFYESPWLPLLDSSASNQIHPYAAAVFPIFIAEKWGAATVRDIWQRCASLGPGPDIVEAADQAISAATGGAFDFQSAVQEFALWNLFTGSRKVLAPPGMSFAAGASYPEISPLALLTHSVYPVSMVWGSWPESLWAYRTLVPYNLGTAYVWLDSISSPGRSTRIEFAGISTADWRVTAVALPVSGSEPVSITRLSSIADAPLSVTLGPGQYSACVLIVTTIRPGEPVVDERFGFSYSADLVVSAADDGEGRLPVGFALEQNYPNPFNPMTTIAFELPVASKVHLAIYNLLGQEVRVLADRPLRAGTHEITWDGKVSNGHQAPSGIYLYRLTAGQYSQSRKMLLLK